MEYDISSTITLVSHVHSAAADFLNSKLIQLGMPEFVSSHGFILFLLSKKDKMTMSEIATEINRDKSTTTVLVRKLLKAGLVMSKTSEKDSRSKYIILTDKGREYNTVTSRLSAELINTFYEGFSDAEKQQLCQLLTRVLHNFT
ncbi:MAG: MarR family transcriptional regulator [Treponema sp.]|nr:MarR family transcriptional regulator [Treponema sp.]